MLLSILVISSPWNHEKTVSKILHVLQFAYPLVLLFFFILAFAVQSVLTASPSDDSEEQTPKVQFGPGGKPLPIRTNSFKRAAPTDFSRSRKLIFEWLSAFACLTWVASAAVVIFHALYDRKSGWWVGQAPTIYIVGSFFVYSLLLISLIDTKPSPTSAQLATWILAVVAEAAVFALDVAIKRRDHKIDIWEGLDVAITLVRFLVLFALLGFYLVFTKLSPQNTNYDSDVSESSSLLPRNDASQASLNGMANGTSGYGTTGGRKHGHGGHPHHGGGDEPGWVRPQKNPSRSWWEYLKRYSILFQYLWPSKDLRLQLMMILCVCIVIVQRGVNVLVPYQVGVITNELSGDDGPVRMPWLSVCLYIGYRLLQGNNGLLGALRSTAWIPISQYSYREISVASFEHVHSLSLDFHLGKKTGEVLSAMNKGSSINTFLEQVTFNVVPMMIDLVVAIVFFLTAFDAYYALVITVVTFWYIYLTIRMATWRADIRRDMVNADREEDAVKNDSMVSYETVKYFNAENYEFERYKRAVKKYQDAEYRVLYSLQIMNVTQNMVFMLGLMITCFIAAYQVTRGQIKVGKFMTLLTYMSQLQQPLNYFGTFYRMIQSAMISSERMLELFKEKPTVVDKPDAKELPTCEGDVRFNDVYFAYDQRKEALKGLNFHCKPGTTTAFVGESGGGKSTVFRLLFRFYNVKSGSIQVDGHDVGDITIDSLRRHIGVVPQDTVLFNETLMYNLKYAKPDATDEEVYDACRAASIHDRIMSFPDAYETKVGDRGLRLSGGEKQRVAIARTILKGPRIILLDEATAALDTDTEQHIQNALKTLGQGRTMLVIAHRLSTITQADQILVLQDGRVIERGTHEELLELNGRYKVMWKKQIRAERVAHEAKELQMKADKLRREFKSGEVNDNSEGSSSSSSPSTSEGEGKSNKKHTEKSSRKPSRSTRSTNSSSAGAGNSSSKTDNGNTLPNGHP
ncbi:uncharacterized protein PV09_07760 [Verruconis gallopava]|uniref:Heavy metal tolerance protein n=1 Tax=Verruconis gallopava TaxID=253628 RepID=A0A0D2A317_9PEZI|nr:uncharacterized protein PV09_07760 [Verruconis gallopava]KIW00780.1 hypothetical protein PV09_07760 [Verruconis gallopava]